MARIYEAPANSRLDTEGKDIGSLDPINRRALLRFWLSSLGIIVAAMGLYLFSHPIEMPGGALAGAIGTAIATLILLFIMNRSLRKIRVISRIEAVVNKRLETVLDQLDDRFAVFNRVHAGEVPVDHLIVGPTGTFSVRISETLDNDGWARSGDIEAAREDAEAMNALLKRLAPEVEANVEPVLCVPAGTTVRVGQEEHGVWVVPAEKLAAALVKRSSQDGAITRNVLETGAFSTDTLQAAAIERAFANYWQMPTRKNMNDFMPPPSLTGEAPA